MKYLFLLIFLTLWLYDNAQVDFEVKTDSLVISEGLQPAYIVLIPQADVKSVKNSWTRKIRNKTKSKTEINDNEISIKTTYISDIHSSPIDVYSFLYEVENDIKLISLFKIDSTFFSFKDTLDINQEKIHFGILNFMREFAIMEYNKTVDKELYLAENKLQSLNKELQKIENKHEAYNKEIMSKEQRIKNSEDKINSLEKDNTRKIEQIDRKKDAIAEITDDHDLKKVAKGQLKDLEKEKKKIEKSLEKERKKIVEYESSIFKTNRKISKNTDIYDEMVIEIEAQTEVVNSIKTKYAITPL